MDNNTSNRERKLEENSDIFFYAFKIHNQKSESDIDYWNKFLINILRLVSEPLNDFYVIITPYIFQLFAYDYRRFPNCRLQYIPVSTPKYNSAKQNQYLIKQNGNYTIISQ
jgi:hypothetical protein